MEARVLGFVTWQEGKGQEMSVETEPSAMVDAKTGKCAVILDQTTFYHEAGGQASDTGEICVGDEVTFHVEDVQQLPSGHVLHIGRLYFCTPGLGPRLQKTIRFCEWLTGGVIFERFVYK